MTTNQINYWNLQELKRANRQKELETAKHNREVERLQDVTSSRTYNVGLGNLAETSRANKTKEQELNRHNIATEMLESRKRELEAYNAGISAYNAETARIDSATKQSEAATHAGTLAESIRTNQMHEQLEDARNQETHRTNLARENIDRYRAATNLGVSRTNLGVEQSKLEENVRHNQATELEIKRNNLINQQLEAAGLMETINNNRARNQTSLIQNLNPMRALGKGGQYGH